MAKKVEKTEQPKKESSKLSELELINVDPKLAVEKAGEHTKK